MMAYSEDHIALAAEYALGTLDAEERAQAEAMMSVDMDFAAMVDAWSTKLGALNQMVGSVEPSPRSGTGSRRRPDCQARRCRSCCRNSPPVEPAAVETAAGCRARQCCRVSRAGPALAHDRHRHDRDRGRLDRARRDPGGSAGFAARRHSPDAADASGAGPAPPAPAQAQYVAVLQKDGGSPAFILTVDGATKNFTVRKVDAAAEPGKSYELWVISDRLGAPRSLGVIGEGDFTARPALAAYDPISSGTRPTPSRSNRQAVRRAASRPRRRYSPAS